jgi:DNA-binding CsgD family transcriptional regulator
LVTIEGESGIGKTALARRSLAASPDLNVLWARADATESDLEYGVLEQLLRAVDRQVLSRYPVLAGDVARSAPFGVGAQMLGVVGDLQAEGPVAIVIDDVQWADARSVEALSFMLRRLSVDPVLVMVLVRGDRDHLEEATRRMLISVEQRLRLSLSGLGIGDVENLAAALGAPKLGADAVKRLYEGTGGHTLYLQTVLSDREGLERIGPGRLPVPPSLAAAIGDQLALLPEPARSLLEMLAIVNAPMPLALLADAARAVSPSQALETAVRAGLVDMAVQVPSCPVAIRHALQRDGIYAGISIHRRRELHGRAVSIVDAGAAWAHRVAALDRPDEDLAGELERHAVGEAARGQLSLAATHLLWASDISPGRSDRERRLLTAATHLMLAEEARGLELRDAVEGASPSPLRSCVLATMAFSSGQLGAAEAGFSAALAEAQARPEDLSLAATIANRLSGTYTLLGKGEMVVEYARWALETGALDAAADSQTRTLVAIGTSQVAGPRAALDELGHVDTDPARVDPVHVDGLSFRGVFHLVVGDLPRAVADLTTSLKMVRNGATITLGLRANSYLALAQYLSGAWDDVLLTAEQAFSEAAIRSRRYELPLMHLAACCVPAGRGATEDGERHARLAEDAARVLDYGQEQLYAGMARALVCQAAGDYLGMADALGPWDDEASLDGRSRMYEALWRPLLLEGLVGSGRCAEATAGLRRLSQKHGQVAFLRPALVWLEGWLAEQQGAPDAAERIYRQGEGTANGASPVYSARLLLAYGRLLRRAGQRRPAVERLRRANDMYGSLRAAPFVARTEEELAACGLRQAPVKERSFLEMTNRETEVAHLVGRGMTNAEIAGELFITPKAVEYHLGNIYVKFGLKGRQQLRRFLSDQRGHAPV